MIDKLIIFGAKYLIFIVVIFFAVFLLKQGEEKRIRILIFGAISLPLTYTLAKILSMFYFDPRPFVQENFTPLIAHVADNGFPSDHTLFSSSLAVVAYFFNRKYGILLLALSFIVGFSRVLAGVHHTVDILGAIAVSFMIGSLVNYLLKVRRIL